MGLFSDRVSPCQGRDPLENMVSLYRVSIEVNMEKSKLENIDFILPVCRKLANIFKLKIVKEDFAKLDPCGATVFLALRESHLALHTWPEYNSAYFDILSSKIIGKRDVSSAKKFLEDAGFINIHIDLTSF